MPDPRGGRRWQIVLAVCLLAAVFLWATVSSNRVADIGSVTPTGPPQQLLGPSSGVPISELGGLAVRADGALVVADAQRAVLLIVGPEGGVVETLGPDLDGAHLEEPMGVATRGSEVFVVDRSSQTILRLGADNHLVGLVALQPPAPYGPNGLAVLPDGRLVLADTGWSRLTIIGDLGAGQPTPSGGLDLAQPMAVAAGPNGDLYITDFERQQVVHTGPDLRPLGAISIGHHVMGIATDTDGRVYVPVPDEHRIRVFAPDGTPLDSIASPIGAPTQVAVNGDVLYVLSPVGVVRQQLAGIGTGAGSTTRPQAPGLRISLPSPDPAELLAWTAIGGIGVLVVLRRRTSRTLPRCPPVLVGLGSLAAIALLQPLVESQARAVATPASGPGVSLLSGVGWLLLVQVIAASAAGLSLRGLARRGGPVGSTELAAIAGITVLGLALRLVLLDQIPTGLWFDAAENGNQALRILQDPAYRPAFIAEATQLPALFMYLDALTIAAFGREAIAVRLPAALLGTATIPALWWLGRRLGGPSLGLAAAFVLATSRWHLNFSRLGLSGIAVPLALAVGVAAAQAGLEAQRRSRATIWFATAGAAVAFGLWCYPSAVFVPLAVLVVVVWGVRANPRARLRQACLGLGIVGATALLLLLPLLRTAVTQPDVVLQRPAATAANTDARGYLESTIQHVLMFTVQGDRNARHNTPGRPELGPFSALFLAGVGVALAAPRHGIALLVPGMGVLLLAGILSLSFEAPQAYRANAAVIPAALLSALPVAALVTRGRRWAAPAIAGLALAGALDAGEYFRSQVQDGAVAAEQSLAETEAALALRELDPNMAVLGADRFVSHPTVRFLAGQRRALVPGMDATAAVPPSTPTPFVAIAALDEPAVVDRARALYPGAPLQTRFGPAARQPVISVLPVSTAQQTTSVGWLAELVDGERVSVATNDVAPAAATLWRAVARVDQTGMVEVTTHDASVWIDGAQVAQPEQPQRELMLPAGAHDLAVRPREPRQTPDTTVAGATLLALRAPGGLLFTRQPDGGAQFMRVDSAPHQIFDAVWGQRWSAQWQGLLSSDAGEYGFRVQARSSARLRIDQSDVVTSVGDAAREVSIHLEAGWHTIEVDYRDDEPYARLFLSWRPPSSDGFQPIPDAVLRPLLP